MNKQPEALRLADDCDEGMVNFENVAAELRRLHDLNAELLQALKDLLDDTDPCGCTDESDGCPLLAARAAIAKAEGENK